MASVDAPASAPASNGLAPPLTRNDNVHVADHARRGTLLIGANGQLGSLLQQELAFAGPVTATTRATLDLENADAIRRVIQDTHPGLIVNAAAYTAVDRAEEDRDRCAAINARAPGILAEEALRIGAPLIHFSTDFVFDGRRQRPYDETDATDPLNVYGTTKLAGEQAVMATGAEAYVFRLGWVYGLHYTNFLTTIRRLASERDVLTIVDDQRGVPTWAGSVATAVGRFAAHLRSNGERAGDAAAHAGVYHMSGMGSASWAEFAAEILRRFPVPGREWVTVRPISTAEFPRPAVRPAYSVMASDRLARTFGIALPDWREQLSLCLRSSAS